MRRTSSRGRTERQKGAEGGYILLDVVVALFIILLGFGVFLGGVSLATRTAARREARVHAIIEARNTHAADHVVVFTGE